MPWDLDSLISAALHHGPPEATAHLLALPVFDASAHHLVSLNHHWKWAEAVVQRNSIEHCQAFFDAYSKTPGPFADETNFQLIVLKMAFQYGNVKLVLELEKRWRMKGQVHRSACC